jgi:murein DD-endopeptidase MepM/ murein hydrolase activator NlpD
VLCAGALAVVPAAGAQTPVTGSGGSGLPDAQPVGQPQGATDTPAASQPAAGGSQSGGTTYNGNLNSVGQRGRRLRKRQDRPVLALFQVAPTTLLAYGTPATITYQVNDRSRFVRVTLAFVRQGSAGALYRYRLGRARTGVPHAFRWRGARGSDLAPQGSYHFRLTARDSQGHRLVRSSQTLGGAPIEVRNHSFPLPGAHSFGGADARFGAPRSGHKHQGQDITAAAGSPVVAPRAGLITWRAYQASGAGYYLVLAGENEVYNYVFMHLQRGSILVNQGDLVTTGQQLASVGTTGESSGPHLHFEIWDGPWYHGGHPIDPLPMLQIWDSYS